MKDVFVSALKKKYEAEVDVAKATIAVYFDKPVEKFDANHGVGLKLTLGITTLITLFYFIYPSKIIEIISFIKVI